MSAKISRRDITAVNISVILLQKVRMCVLVSSLLRQAYFRGFSCRYFILWLGKERIKQILYRCDVRTRTWMLFCCNVFIFIRVQIIYLSSSMSVTLWYSVNLLWKIYFPVAGGTVCQSWLYSKKLRICCKLGSPLINELNWNIWNNLWFGCLTLYTVYNLWAAFWHRRYVLQKTKHWET
jgi:hypothetical protein